MHRKILALAAGVGIAIGMASPAQAAMQSCGTVNGGLVAADKPSTSCGLARSAARDWWDYSGNPRTIYGYSSVRGRYYQLRRSAVFRDGATYQRLGGQRSPRRESLDRLTAARALPTGGARNPTTTSKGVTA